MSYSRIELRVTRPFVMPHKPFPVGTYTVVEKEGEEVGEWEVSVSDLNHSFIKGCIATGRAELLRRGSVIDEWAEGVAERAVLLRDTLVQLQSEAEGAENTPPVVVPPVTEGVENTPPVVVPPATEGVENTPPVVVPPATEDAENVPPVKTTPPKRSGKAKEA